MYLSDVKKGGETVFPNAEVTMSDKKYQVSLHSEAN